MASKPDRRNRLVDWALVVAACIAGATAALAAGVVEDALDWLFVGVPLLLLAFASAWGFVRRQV
jgi:hypothetical protein